VVVFELENRSRVMEQHVGVEYIRLDHAASIMVSSQILAPFAATLLPEFELAGKESNSADGS
jgi:hypothetical protein